MLLQIVLIEFAVANEREEERRMCALLHCDESAESLEPGHPRVS